MKNIIIAITVSFLILITGCNDNFLDKEPVTELSEANAFTTSQDFRTYMWQVYNMFTDTRIGTSTSSNGWGMRGQYISDANAGYFGWKQPSNQNPFAFQTISSVTEGNGWNFGYIRVINIMLSHIDDSKMSQAEKDHWRSVGYFFHSFWYMELIDRFSDVPYIEKVLGDKSEEAFAPRTPRDEVAAKILERLKWAEEHIGRDDFDGKNTINKSVIQAALSRFTLREGTWRKYHKLGNEEVYLRECERVSKILMDKYPQLYHGTETHMPAAGYGELWTTDNLQDVPGIILYKSYVMDVNAIQGGCYVERTASHSIEANQHTVDLYLMKNGKPIGNTSSGYHGDKTMYDTFRDRDPRLYQTITPPYKVLSAADAKKAGTESFGSWGYTTDPKDREYIDILGANTICSNPGEGMKRLPNQNWSASLVPEIPRTGSGGFVQCRSKYYVWKLTCNWERNFNNGRLNVADKPIFKIEEVLLNYAEAKKELGEFDQSIADMTINKLRERAGIDKMILAEIDDSFDPNRGEYNPKGTTTMEKVEPVLWEIRRERIIELMGEGFGFYDVRRWRMAPWFLDRPTLGIWTTKEKAKSYGLTLYNPSTGESDGADGSMTEGYLLIFGDPKKSGKGWLEKYYLYQVPTDEIILNKDLAPNNPGWQVQ